ncbi:MAG: hypothetical protein A3F70_04795 [Acidobacteria bacterium RIFCSPLOWO2_12_FULL_67_14]|nr:MAG: hypothetical protein A3H29_14725 [Acidobacteria bacterium RIFCSPLOWO2_02_FULL_67_21]OFW41287.1 MAG: hypothetical protein A3F70_04795 [Acidobacteria bacterium RIFCSPLOWO2_12_FULL_67_14]
MLFVLALSAILAGASIPQLLGTLDRSRAWAAARYLAARMSMARAHAVMRSAHVALRFEQGEADTTFQLFVDENHNGVRTSDIAGGIDRAMNDSVRLSDLFPGVVIGVAGAAGTDPIRIGSSNLLSFTPAGTATPGTIYVRSRDGLQLAVRVTGATGRARVMRYVPDSDTWVESF